MNTSAQAAIQLYSQWPWAVIEVSCQGRMVGRFPSRREAVQRAVWLNRAYRRRVFLAIDEDGLPGKRG